MKRKQVWQYKCDWCGKKKYSASHMSRHEKGCTMNPNRVCGMCRLMGFEQVHPYKLVEICRSFEQIKNDVLLQNDKDEEVRVFSILEDSAQECPACILSALRMSDYFISSEDIFDYKKARDDFFSELNESRSRDYY